MPLAQGSGSVLAKESGFCRCGAEVTKLVNRVRLDDGEIAECDACTPDILVDDISTIRVRVMGRKQAKASTTWGAYSVVFDGAAPNDAPPGFEKKPFTMAGPVGELSRNDVVLVAGAFKTHPKFGLQFEAMGQATLAVKESQTALVAFLARFPQIGQYRALECLAKFGGLEGTLKVLDETPERLTEISGITTERAEVIKAEYDRAAGYRTFMLWAAQHQLQERVQGEAIEVWGEHAQEVIQENPFELMGLLENGLTFKKADEVAAKIGFPREHPLRRREALAYYLRRELKEHCWVLESDVKGPDTQKELSLSPDEIEETLKVLEQATTRKGRNGSIIHVEALIARYDERVYLKEVYDAEHVIAEDLAKRLTTATQPIPYDASVWKFTPHEHQEAAVQNACKSSVSITTGGPGTGKTASLLALLQLADRAKVKYALCAPTGKAAKRMKELTGRDASTIHRLIAQQNAEGSYGSNIEADLVVVDEVSMVGTVLLAELLKRVRSHARVLLVGDVNQLASIDAGQVLRDLIDSNKIPVTTLTQVYRQVSDENKRIPEVAQAINRGEMFDLAKRGTDVNFIPLTSPEDIANKIVEGVSKTIPERYGFSSEDIQVICPQRGEQDKANWLIGTRSLNMQLQEALNPLLPGEQDLFIADGYKVRPRDRVIQKENNYDLQIMNGDQGSVVEVKLKAFNPDRHVITSWRSKRNADPKAFEGAKEPATTHVVVDFGTHQVGFTREECRHLHLAYAITVHSSQGSGFKALIMPAHPVNAFMLTRQILYTGITRAEQYVALVGVEHSIKKAIKNTRGELRRTTLIERLDEACAQDTTEAERAQQLEAAKILKAQADARKGQRDIEAEQRKKDAWKVFEAAGDPGTTVLATSTHIQIRRSFACPTCKTVVSLWIYPSDAPACSTCSTSLTLCDDQENF